MGRATALRWLASALALLSAAAEPARASALAPRIDALFADSAANAGPGYAIGVIRDGRLSFARGYGLADVQRKIRLTPRTPMNLASLSKQFTAAAVAIEVSRGRLSLDRPIGGYWPGLPPHVRRVTVAQLVYMTSGLPEYYRLTPVGRGWGPEDGFTVAEALRAVFAAPSEFEPGTRWAYSNTNYQLLAELLARRNRTAFATHLDRAVLRPLGLRSTWVDAPPLPAGRSAATAYVRSGQGWSVARRVSRHYGGGGMFSTIEDLARWDRAIFRDQRLGPAVSRLMVTTRRFDHPKVNDGFGLVHGQFEGRPTLWYEGGDHGVSSYMLRLTGEKITIFCLSNIGEGDCAGRAKAVARLVLARPATS